MASRVAAAEGEGTVIKPAGHGWAHGFLPAMDLWAAEGPPEDRERREDLEAPGGTHLHGPCDGCGFRYYTGATAPLARCPNCGHQPSSTD